LALRIRPLHRPPGHRRCRWSVPGCERDDLHVCGARAEPRSPSWTTCSGPTP